MLLTVVVTVYPLAGCSLVSKEIVFNLKKGMPGRSWQWVLWRLVGEGFNNLQECSRVIEVVG